MRVSGKRWYKNVSADSTICLGDLTSDQTTTDFISCFIGDICKIKKKRIRLLRYGKNKAGYTASPVACGWAGDVIEVTRSFGQEQ